MNKQLTKNSSIKILFGLFFALQIHTLTALEGNLFKNFKISFPSFRALVGDESSSSLGIRDLSPEMQKKVDKMVAELGLSGTVQVKQMSDATIAEGGNYNAFATNNMILVNEETFSQLSYDEQRFLIGHEAGHVVNKDVVRGCLAAFTGSFLIQAKMFMSSNRMVRLAALPVGFLSARLVAAAYQRYAEKKADQYALENLNCHDGAISWISRFAHNQQDYSGLKALLAWLTATHPTKQERIAFAQKAKNNK